MHLPRQRTGASGAPPRSVLVHGGLQETVHAVGELGDSEWTVGSVTVLTPGTWRVVLLPRD